MIFIYWIFIKKTSIFKLTGCARRKTNDMDCMVPRNENILQRNTESNDWNPNRIVVVPFWKWYNFYSVDIDNHSTKWSALYLHKDNCCTMYTSSWLLNRLSDWLISLKNTISRQNEANILCFSFAKIQSSVLSDQMLAASIFFTKSA